MTQAANLAALGSNTNTTGILPAAGGGTAGTAGVTGFKNRIINGAMAIDQRNNGSQYTTASGNNAYCLDRFRMYYSSTSKYTVQQNAGSVTPPAGFSNYLGVTSSAATSLTSSDIYLIQQYVEACNTADFNLGLSTAVTFTMSFWVRSSLTGTFGGTIGNASSYYYGFTYSIPVANTWTFVSITIPGPTAGTWNNSGNQQSFQINWQLQTGSTYLMSAGSWQSTSTGFGVTGATNVLSTNGATWYITGVQLEVGSAATNFDVRSYGTELALCQRYFELIGYGNNSLLISLQSTASNQEWETVIRFLVQKRANPTVIKTNTGWTDSNCVATVATVGNDMFTMSMVSSGSGRLYSYNNSGGYLTVSAEL